MSCYCVLISLCCGIKEKPVRQIMQMLFRHHLPEISHLSEPLVLLVIDMFIISYVKGYYEETASSCLAQ